VIDGDTLQIGRARVRLFGIDAPESNQTCQDAAGLSYACGKAATEGLKDLIGRRPVKCQSEGRDRYGRTIATCTAAGLDLGAEMVKRGLALAFVKYSPRYLPEQQAAQAARLGV
jgi:endonuclease YncB( thermonuclease family)